MHPAAVGRRIEVAADLNRVRVFHDGGSSPTMTGSGPDTRAVRPEHVAAAKAMRQQRFEMVRPVADPEVQTRRLTDYDELLGVNTGVDGGLT